MDETMELEIESLSNNGCGVGHQQGKAVFVPFGVPGDRIRARLKRDAGSYAEASIESILTASEWRINPDCGDYHSCGGCCFREMRYDCELRAKEGFVRDAFTRLGRLKTNFLPIIGSPLQTHYRNKVEYIVQPDKDGRICAGFHAREGAGLVTAEACMLQPEGFSEIRQSVCELASHYGIPVYERENGSGLLRHILLRQSSLNGQILVCLVINGSSFPHEAAFARDLLESYPSIHALILNSNTAKNSQITGSRSRTLAGCDTIRDEIGGVPVAVGALSFFQVNQGAAELLYRCAEDYTHAGASDHVLDLYCGMGTIGLSLGRQCGWLTGVEIEPEAVQSARRSAWEMGIANAKFLCADAEQAAAQFLHNGQQTDIMILDPPRKGCSRKTLESAALLSPSRIVMVSCDPATAARDIRFLTDKGYECQKVQPVDLFPRTRHVETVSLLSKG